MRARTRAAALLGAAALLLSGCATAISEGADAPVQADVAAAPEQASAPEQADVLPTRIAALDIDETAGVIRVATDRGIYVATLPDTDTDTVARSTTLLGDRIDDVKSYQRLGARVLISGHPNDPEVSADERLGLWVGDTESGEWAPFALTGEVDFHAITAAGPTAADAIIAAADTVSNTLFYSPDGGESWQKGAVIGATSLAFTSDGSTLVAVTPVGLKVSTDRGRTFLEPEAAPALQLVATPPVGTKEWRIVGVDSAGALWSSTDGDRWQQFGALAAVPADLALGKSGEVIYVATADGVFVSNDGGETLTLMVTLDW
ncbi:BNR/Asp-box repeat-containing protein [Microcella alkaliphila]|uniref:BNR/Asp-box repeat-containing protein n=1 Tax=Microcella alkaliphila TaxID=279828 RepID=A0A0U5BHW4_9MICO|nr:BNR/Asp-box repeat-containing protein [Microcella alkaliphila]